MADWNPINVSNLTGGELLGLFSLLFGFVIFLFLLKKLVKVSMSK